MIAEGAKKREANGRRFEIPCASRFAAEFDGIGA
jgi:hypothetical protein